MTTHVLWFRRDLRLSDHPALTSAAAEGEVVGLFVVDPRLWAHGGPARRAWVAASVRALRDATDGALVVRAGDPAAVVPEVAAAVGATTVRVTAETTPGGRRRDARVASALAKQGAVGQPDGSPYAVAPGSVRTGQGTPYQVFTPFARAWREHGWDEQLARHLRYGGRLIGICGGLQMLGETIADPHGIEGAAGASKGFGWLELHTELERDKQLRNVRGHLTLAAAAVQGYEIHMGRSTGAALEHPLVVLEDGRPDGAISPDGRILGTYVHGLFEEPTACAALR